MNTGLKFCLIVFLTTNTLYAQSFFQITSSKSSVKYPFELYRNIIVMPVYLNGSGPFNFILDTGAGHCLITDPDVVDALGLTKGRNLEIKGQGQLPAVEAFLVYGVEVRFDEVKSLPLTFSAFKNDPFLISEYLGIKIHGILGYEFFSSFAVEINYKSSYLKLYNPDKIKANRKWEIIPLQMQNNKPFIAAKAISYSDTTDLLMLLDTGAGFPISIELQTDSSALLPEKYIATELGIGLSGPVNGYLGRISEFQIAEYSFKNIVVGFPHINPDFANYTNEIRQGSIGNFVLNRFTVLFDYSASTVYLKSSPDLKNGFPYDRTGIELIASGSELEEIIVHWVKPGSPAEKMGILPGDIILEINNKQASSFSLTAIDHVLSNPKSNSVLLKIKRNNSIFYTIVIMENII